MKLRLLQGNFSDAKASLEESEAIFRQLGDRWKLALSRHDAGLYYLRIGAYEQAHMAFAEGLGICRELGGQREIAAFLHNMGVMAQRQGNLRDARHYYQEALEVFRDVGDRRALASAHHNLGEVAEFDGDYVEAERRQQASLAICRQIGDQPRIADALNALGFVALGRGAYERAEICFLEALKQAWDLDVKTVVLEALVGISNLLAIRGEVMRALEMLALVLSHPITIPDVRKNRAEPLLSRLMEACSADLAAAAEQRGHHLELAEVVREILGFQRP